MNLLIARLKTLRAWLRHTLRRKPRDYLKAPATASALSFENDFLQWIESIERGDLLPTASVKLFHSAGVNHFMAPLQYWLKRASSSETDLLFFISHLERVRAAGLSLDHIQDLSDGKSYLSSSRRPISHMALANHNESLPLWFLKGLLDHGADPNARDSMGIPLLFFCGSSVDSNRASASWRLLTENGADPHHQLYPPESFSHGHAALIQIAFQAAPDQPMTPRDFARFLSNDHPAIAATLPYFFDSVLALETQHILEENIKAPLSRAAARL